MFLLAQIKDHIPASWPTSQVNVYIKLAGGLVRKEVHLSKLLNVESLYLERPCNFPSLKVQTTSNLQIICFPKMGQWLGICRSECSFPHLHGVVRSWGQPTGARHRLHATEVHCSHRDLHITGDSGKVLLGGQPAWQPWHQAEATFHLFPANQETGAETHGASETWDGGSGGEKTREMVKGSIRDSRCQQLGKAGDSLIPGDASYSVWVHHPRCPGLISSKGFKWAFLFPLHMEERLNFPIFL